MSPVIVAPVHPHPHHAQAAPAVAGPHATVVVSLPAEAKLYVDGQLATLSSGTRTFTTPELTAGKDYTYTLRVETTRNGEAVSTEKKIVVRANQTTRVDFNNPQAAPARVTVKLPADARLFVNDVACPLTSETRSFETPQLEPGRKYEYVLRAEAVRDGQTVRAARAVVMEAGQNVSVTFDNLTTVQAAAR